MRASRIEVLVVDGLKHLKHIDQSGAGFAGMSFLPRSHQVRSNREKAEQFGLFSSCHLHHTETEGGRLEKISDDWCAGICRNHRCRNRVSGGILRRSRQRHEEVHRGRDQAHRHDHHHRRQRHLQNQD
jgi:hypothetical protein